MSKDKLQLLKPNKTGMLFEGIGIVTQCESRYITSEEETILTRFTVKTPAGNILCVTFDKTFPSDSDVVLKNKPLYMGLKFSKEYGNYRLLNFRHLTEEEFSELDKDRSTLLTSSGAPEEDDLSSLNDILDSRDYDKLFKTLVKGIANVDSNVCKLTLLAIETINGMFDLKDLTETLFFNEPATRAHMFRSTLIVKISRFMMCSRSKATVYAFEITNTPLSCGSDYTVELNLLGNLIDKYVFAGINERRLYDRSN